MTAAVNSPCDFLSGHVLGLFRSGDLVRSGQEPESCTRSRSGDELLHLEALAQFVELLDVGPQQRYDVMRVVE